MYDRFYGFSERPFSLLPDPDFLYPGERHRAALDALELAIFNHSGFCVISGEIGAGKTTLIRELLNRLDERVEVGLVSNTHESFGELMQWILAAFALSCDNRDRLAMHKCFVDYVIQRYAAGKHTLLIIDEAQNLSMAALEELRMLSNLNSGKDLVLQIILVGQSELRDRLRSPALAQFTQRIGTDYYLSGLDENETCHYIRHRLVHAGGDGDLFTPEACRRVHDLAGGIPRLINRLCDLSLVYGYASQRERIDVDLVDAVANEQRLGEAMESARLRSVEPPPVLDDVAMQAPESGETGLEASPVQTPARAGRSPDSGSDAAAVRPAPVETDLHTLVVDAERAAGERRGRGAVWYLAALVVGVAVFGAWMGREIWLPSTPASVNGIAEHAQPREQAAREQAAREQAAREQAAREQAAREQAAREQAAREQAAREQAAREQAAREQAAREQAAREQAAREQAAREQAAREQAAREPERQADTMKPGRPAPARPAFPASWLTPEWSEEDDEDLADVGDEPDTPVNIEDADRVAAPVPPPVRP